MSKPTTSSPTSIISGLLIVFCLLFSPGYAAAKDNKFRIAWSIYVGWMPWDYGDKSGIVKKWADKYGIEIDIVQVNDYVESINQYTTGGFDGCVMTNMDALTIPAAGGVDSTALIVGDFSNGNDGIILKGHDKLEAIKGQKVNLVELSVSHYLLVRALDTIGSRERDLKVVNTSDADLVSAFASADVTAVVTWNPLLSEILKTPDAHKVFDSSKIPGEIIDLLVVNTKTLEQNPNLGKALVGAWYEIMTVMAKEDAQGHSAKGAMATAAGTDLAGFESQLNTTRMFYQAGDALDFSLSNNLIKTMERVAEFSFEHGLLGESAAHAGYVGISYPNEKVSGDTSNIKLRFNSDYTRLAAEKAL
ncbi:MAG: putative urea ABC transporter substrate-binding protein [Methylomonas sp.]|jgi:NitT/TauT family transport system substrate-binding protein|uniref:putative urea ABC transporter substrate-binding protein n=1 Tax=Methylomonas sp. TaxID=418 RepID=UPI0025D7D897|nr:putative urea ABC transporter substrate-binding protein [Methylomonas sp.]MCK9607395.1 putative urea ABC transporter substrate-binding protein [Methylomonas sp.]